MTAIFRQAQNYAYKVLPNACCFQQLKTVVKTKYTKKSIKQAGHKSQAKDSKNMKIPCASVTSPCEP